jgi:hypothetical protein
MRLLGRGWTEPRPGPAGALSRVAVPASVSSRANIARRQRSSAVLGLRGEFRPASVRTIADANAANALGVGAVTEGFAGQTTRTAAGMESGWISSTVSMSPERVRAPLARWVTLDIGSRLLRSRVPGPSGVTAPGGRVFVCHNRNVVLPEPVPPLPKNANFASIMPDRSCAAPGVNEPEATQSSSEKLRLAGTRSEMEVLVMPECRALHGPCFRASSKPAI